ncbi:MAG: radical SAM protein [Ignavibacteriae bacterium]|nr:radical SAM protein [Ignavibacteriota bacterium]
MINYIKESPLNILIQPTDNCNLECLYCYKGNKGNNKMSDDLMLKVLTESIAYNSKRKNSTLFIWHGGEPSIMPLSFYYKAFRFTENINSEYRISHTFQTNGYLISEELLDLFSQFKVSISISLDGPANYHDKIRFTKNKKGTHKVILNNIEKAKRKDIEIGILMSITNNNVQYIEQIFRYCYDNNFSFGINPISSDLFSKHEDLEVHPQKYLESCIKVFDLWFFQKKNPIRANPGFGVTQLILSQNRISDCFLSENCQYTFISIDPKGNIYPCNRFDNNEGFKFGNILNTDLEDILISPTRIKLLERCGNIIPECQNCEIRKYCNGGCMHHAICHNENINSPDHLCIVYKALIKHALSRINSVLITN